MGSGASTGLVRPRTIYERLPKYGGLEVSELVRVKEELEDSGSSACTWNWRWRTK